MAHPHDTVSYIPNFLDILSSPAGSLPKSVCWVVQFEDLKNTIFPGIQLALSYEPGATGRTRINGAEPSSWAVAQAASLLTGEAYQETAGCVFCHAIDLPSMDVNVISEGNLQYNAFLRTYVGQGRVDYPILRASFLETNISFADTVLRPWAIATATFGMIARAKRDKENYRTNMTCWQLGGSDNFRTIIKEITFYDICCISVNNEELNYVSQSQPVYREAKFIYNYYTISTDQSRFRALATRGLKPWAKDNTTTSNETSAN